MPERAAMKTLLIVFHTGGVKTAQMAEAVERGARSEENVRVIVKRCAEAGPEDVLGADGLILGTPENFGYMSGMMKDFLERIFYACEGKVNGRPWALFVGAGHGPTEASAIGAATEDAEACAQSVGLYSCTMVGQPEIWIGTGPKGGVRYTAQVSLDCD